MTQQTDGETNLSANMDEIDRPTSIFDRADGIDMSMDVAGGFLSEEEENQPQDEQPDSNSETENELVDRDQGDTNNNATRATEDWRNSQPETSSSGKSDEVMSKGNSQEIAD